MNSTIQNLRIPLTLLVIFAHASASSAPAKFISMLSGDLAVATFFVISGYLFFLKSQTYSLFDYRKKLQSRTKTLLIPYLIWVPLYLLFKAYGMHYSVLDLLKDFGGLNIYWRAIPVSGGITPWGWNNTSYGPFYGPFWYVEHLMLLVLISPLIFSLLKRWGKCTLAALVVLYGAGFGVSASPIQVFSIMFFCFGCYLALNKLPLYISHAGLRYALYGVFLILLVLLSVFNETSQWGGWIIKQLLIPVGVLVFLNLFSGWHIDNKFINSLIPCSFLVYAAHMYFIPYSYSDKISWMWSNSVTMEFLVFLVRPLVIYLLISSIYYILKRYSPKLLSVLTGER